MALRQPPGAAFTVNGGSLLLPDRRGFIMEMILGVSSAESLKNRILPGVAPTASEENGPLVYDAVGVTVHGSTPKRIKTGIIAPASDHLSMFYMGTKGGAVGALEAIDGSGYRTGFALTTTTIQFRCSNTSGQASGPWPDDIGAKSLFLWGYADWNGFPNFLMGLDGDKLVGFKGGHASEATSGTTGGFEKSGLGEFVFARENGGTQSNKASYGAISTRKPAYEEALLLYQRVYARWGAAVVR